MWTLPAGLAGLVSRAVRHPCRDGGPRAVQTLVDRCGRRCSRRRAAAPVSARRSPVERRSTQSSRAGPRGLSHRPPRPTRRSPPTVGRGPRSRRICRGGMRPSSPGGCRCATTCTSASASWPRPVAWPSPGACGSHARDRARARSRDEAGAGEPVLLVHGLGGDEGLVPADAGRARRQLPRRSRSTCPASATRTSRSRAATTRRSSPARSSTCSTRSSSSARTSSATAWAAGSRSRSASAHPERVRRLALLAPSLAWRRDRPWAPLLRARPPGARSRPARAAAGRRGGSSAALIPGGRRRLERGRRRRVPARLPHAARPRRVLRRRAQHLPRGAARREGLLDPAARAARRGAVRLGAARPARPDRLRAPRRATRCPAPRHLELDCGHVPQLERPQETHAAVSRFLAGG